MLGGGGKKREIVGSHLRPPCVCPSCFLLSACFLACLFDVIWTLQVSTRRQIFQFILTQAQTHDWWWSCFCNFSPNCKARTYHGSLRGSGFKSKFFHVSFQVHRLTLSRGHVQRHCLNERMDYLNTASCPPLTRHIPFPTRTGHDDFSGTSSARSGSNIFLEIDERS